MLSLSVLVSLPFLTTALAQGAYGKKGSSTSSSSPSTTTGAATSVHTILVGKGGLVFTPNSITAKTGDQVEFMFEAAGHTVAQGSFSNPCQPLDSSAFYSGMVSPGGKPFTITVNNTDPLAFYCSTPGHCEAGMVGVINPSSGKTQAAYAKAASSAKSSKSPPRVQGGVFAVAKAGSSGSSPTSASRTGASTTPTPTPGSASRSAIMGAMALVGVGIPIVIVSFGAF